MSGEIVLKSRWACRSRRERAIGIVASGNAQRCK